MSFVELVPPLLAQHICPPLLRQAPLPSSLRRSLLLPVVMVALAPPLLGQVSARWSSCKSDSLATFNCAQYYTGKVTLTSDLKGPDIHTDP